MWILLGFAVTLGVAYTIYFSCNHGMSHSARGQQTRRMLFATIAAWLPMVAGWTLMPFVVGGAWMLTYPLLYHLTNRKVSPDYENYADTTFGIYLIGWLTTLTLLATLWPPLLALVGVVEFVLLLIPFGLWVYYILYGTCIDANGMQILQETHVNEVIEFARSFRWWQVVGCLVAVIGLLVGCIAGNIWIPTPIVAPMPFVAESRWIMPCALGIYLILIGYYLCKPSRSITSRTGFVTLYNDILEYKRGNALYMKGVVQRMEELMITPLGNPYTEPHTILMVIGESASRDYMSAFSPIEHDTTPWMRQMAADTEHSILYKHAYSCAMHTVQALEKALTEMNQYNDKKFNESCSIVDIAHALGYRVHWYSNQGHLGCFDTPVTIVADTSDVAKWTKQDLGRVQYDETLLDFLPELDPTQNNLLVIHLKGSHFNYLNRYPNETHTIWGEAGVQEDVLNYENSLHYTDSVLQQAYEYCRERLNLKAMVYCSDHAAIPDRRRTPNFNGFRNTRIPLFIWLSDDYLQSHPERVEALKLNEDKYFTNDLLYELMLGIFDVESNRFNPENSLAYRSYKYKREDLLTFDGKERIADDDER